jgi:BirA family transcriptional regulator, biotin operon repressor / biotin---[acetyl-CoA-carboxylase] ligase
LPYSVALSDLSRPVCYIISADMESGISAYLRKNLRTRVVGREIHYLEATPSTMDLARELAEGGVPEGAAVIAGTQKSGRGRLGRTWLSPEGALATSIVLRPQLEAISLIPALSAVAVLRAIRRMGITAGIKWPNDVLIQGKKVCGILIENAFETGELKYSVIGIGINVNLDPSSYPAIAAIATSLSTQLGKPIPVQEVALGLYSEMDALYAEINKPDAILYDWINNMETLGKRVSVNSSGCTMRGIAEAVDHGGNLILRLDDGSARVIVAGDVSNVRDSAEYKGAGLATRPLT